jgi:hypothetical protein
MILLKAAFLHQSEIIGVLLRYFLFIFLLSLGWTQLSWGYNKFFCQCQATGPGFEETNKQTGGIDKICSYSCSCIAWGTKKERGTDLTTLNPVTDLKVKVSRLPTSAASFETWDKGSHICHGQYSYRETMDAPNWKIKVRFDTFGITDQGDVIYPEDAKREIAQGINFIGFKYSKTALEISFAISENLKRRVISDSQPVLKSQINNSDWVPEAHKNQPRPFSSGTPSNSSAQ